MNALFKLLIGVVLLVVPLGMYAYELMNGLGGVFGLNLLQSLGILLQGSVPLFVMLIGLFVVWLELDELKMEKELKKEEAKEEVKNIKNKVTASKTKNKTTKKTRKKKK